MEQHSFLKSHLDSAVGTVASRVHNLPKRCPNENALHFVCHLLSPFLSNIPRMPVGKRQSRDAKQKWKEGRTGFAKRAAMPGPNASDSDYCPSTTDEPDESAADLDSSDDRGRASEVGTAVVELQRLYSVFLPSHLRPNEENREKRRKTKDRRAVYTRDSRMTLWRRGVAQKKAAQGCATLDGFIQRKVCKPRDPRSDASHRQLKRQRSPSPLEEDPVAQEIEDLDADEASRASSDIEILAQPANTGSDCAIPVPGSTLARSIGDLAAARPEEDVARSVVDIAPPHALPSIEDPVDQLTADLAAFCFDQLERRLTLGDEDREMGGTDEFEGELRVRS